MIEFTLTQTIFSSNILTYISLIGGYAILGGGIKYIDDAFDERTFRIPRAIFLAPLIGILWAFIMSMSQESATILAAVVLGVFLKGKIDNLAHKLGIVTILLVVFLSGVINILWLPLVILTIAGLVDEIFNDYVDKKIRINRFARLFFEYRMVMKLAVLALVLWGSFGAVYFFAFVSFDIAYAAVMHYSMYLKHTRKFYYHQQQDGFLERALKHEDRRNVKSIE